MDLPLKGKCQAGPVGWLDSLNLGFQSIQAPNAYDKAGAPYLASQDRSCQDQGEIDPVLKEVGLHAGGCISKCRIHISADLPEAGNVKREDLPRQLSSMFVGGPLLLLQWEVQIRV